MLKNTRRFIVFFLTGIALIILFISGQSIQQAQAQPTTTPTATSSLPVASPDSELNAYPAELQPLPYANNALEQVIDAQTMELHHDRHHASYVENLNEALEQTPELQNQSAEALLRDLDSVPEDLRTEVQNNGGGHLNHTIFWQIMSPEGGGEPTGEIAQEINETFGDFPTFQAQFNEAGGDRFGSGWVWLVRNPQGQLEITSTPNQDNPIMEGLYPIMGNDVWEHAYYLRYQNRRTDYLSSWWDVVNWDEVNRRAQVSLQMQTN